MDENLEKSNQKAWPDESFPTFDKHHGVQEDETSGRKSAR